MKGDGNDHQPRMWQKGIQKFASSKTGAWTFSRILHYLDDAILKLTDNQKSLTSILSGVPVIVLTSIGAKSGEPRSVPLLGLEKDKNIILIASNWGQAHHPGWYYNLKANPEAQLSIGWRVGFYIARDATDVERDEYWEEAINMYAGYAEYKKRAVTRKIPMFVLSPKMK
jgi:deazaflavin-dependent oxidoreductase (nitroreductase family)